MPISRDIGADGARSTRRWIGLPIVLVALVAAACASDDPVSEAGGVGVCALERPGEAESALAVDDTRSQSVAVVFADEGHDEEEPHDDEEAPHDDEEAPHDEGETAEVDWVVDIEMNEFAYLCSLPDIELGTTLALHFTNTGAVEHEAVIGDLSVQNEAEAEMLAGGGGDGHAHGAPSITLGPGESGTLVVEFDEPGELIIGCHIGGHWDAGMRSDFIVA